MSSKFALTRMRMMAPSYKKSLMRHFTGNMDRQNNGSSATNMLYDASIGRRQIIMSKEQIFVTTQTDLHL